jgi:hypothetical protein
MSTDGTWIIPAKTIQLPDGSTLVKPGKAVQRCKAAEAAKITGVSRKVLAALAECGLIRRAQVSPAGAMYYVGDIEEFIARTEADPAFWTAAKVKAYLTGRTIKDARPKK